MTKEEKKIMDECVTLLEEIIDPLDIIIEWFGEEHLDDLNDFCVSLYSSIEMNLDIMKAKIYRCIKCLDIGTYVEI